MLRRRGGRGRGTKFKGPLRKPFVFCNFEKPSEGPNARIPPSDDTPSSVGSDCTGQPPDFKKLKEQAQVENKSGQFADAPMAIGKHSAYEDLSTSAETQMYYCDRCFKKLDGPKAYQAHMTSKGHREELRAKGLLKWRSRRVTRSRVTKVVIV